MVDSKFTASVGRRLLKFINGASSASVRLPGFLLSELLNEGIISKIHGTKRGLKVIDAEGCRVFLAQKYTSGMCLEDWIEMKTRQEVLRSEQVAKAANSKLRYARTVEGFLFNCYEPIEATLHGVPCVFSPLQGTSVFMQDYRCFRIPEDVVVIGMENGENFRYIRGQQYLFEGMKVLFVSRYPQSKDLRTWLQMIPNRYIHFGDFDLAGVSIFLTEFYVHLGDRAEFFVPSDVEERIKNGNRELYDNQYSRYMCMDVKDKRLKPLVGMIHKYRRGYEQEGYIKE